MERNRKLEKGYAIYSSSVQAKSKYRVTTLPTIQFKTKAKALRYAKSRNLKDFRIYVVYGLPARMVK